jgi:hypothetical protein
MPARGGAHQGGCASEPAAHVVGLDTARTRLTAIRPILEGPALLAAANNVRLASERIRGWYSERRDHDDSHQ